MWIEFAILTAVGLVLWSASRAQSQAASSDSSSPGDWSPSDGSYSADPDYDVIPVAKWEGTDATGIEFVDRIENMVTEATRPGIDEIVQRWADAIQRVEGYTQGTPNITEPKTGLTGSKAFRNNNPGNLRSAGDLGMTTAFDLTGELEHKYGVFSSYELGRQGLVNDLYAKIRKYPDATVLDIMRRYAPAADNNNPEAYAASVSQALGVDVNTQLQNLGA